MSTTTATETRTRVDLKGVVLPSHFHSDCEVHVIVSTGSGQHKAQEYHDDKLKPFLDSLGLVYRTHVTASAKTIIELTQLFFISKARKGIKQTIILLSGDGGVIDIVSTLAVAMQQDVDDSRSAIIFAKPVICLVPMGTANALAWSSGCGADPLKTMMRGRARSVPMFQVKFSPGARLVTNEAQSREEIDSRIDGNPTMYGVVVASWGLHASLVALSDSKEYRKHGIGRFRMAAEVLIEEAHRYQGIVKIESHRGAGWKPLYDDDNSTGVSQEEHIYVLGTTVSGLEEKFKISPHTRPLEGKMRVVAFKPWKAEEIVHLLTLAYQEGRHVDEPSVVYEEIKRMRVEVYEEEERWRQVCIDGKIISLESGGWMEVKILPGMGIGGKQVVELIC